MVHDSAVTKSPLAARPRSLLKVTDTKADMLNDLETLGCSLVAERVLKCGANQFDATGEDGSPTPLSDTHFKHNGRSAKNIFILTLPMVPAKTAPAKVVATPHVQRTVGPDDRMACKSRPFK